MCFYKNVQNMSWQYCYHWSQKAKNVFTDVWVNYSVTGSNLRLFFTVAEPPPYTH